MGSGTVCPIYSEGRLYNLLPAPGFTTAECPD